MKTKICHVTSVHGRNDVRIFTKQCKSLANYGYDVTLLVNDTLNDEEKNNIKIISTNIISNNRIHRMIFVTKAIYKKALSIDADVYHIHDPELLQYALKLRKKGKKVIFDSHEDVEASILEKEYIPIFLRKIIRKLYRLYSVRILKKLDYIITVTPHLVDYYTTINKNTYLITNYPIIDNNIMESNQSRNIVFAGGITKQWNHHNIIEAINKCENVKYILCGQIKDEYLSQLRELKGYDKVEYKGVVPHNDVNSILKESCIGMALLEYVLNAGGKLGTLGNTKIFEYMNAGLPVICTDFILWKQIIDKYRCGVCVNPKDVNEIETAINSLIKNPNIAKIMGENGKKAISEEFNWGAEEKKLFKIYEKICY